MWPFRDRRTRMFKVRTAVAGKWFRISRRVYNWIKPW